MANLTEKPWVSVSVSVPEFGEWGKRNKGVFTRDYSRHFEMMRSVRRYRKKLLSWTSIRSTGNVSVLDQSSKPVMCRDQSCSLSRHDSVSRRRFSNKTRNSPAVGRYMRFLLCCVGH